MQAAYARFFVPIKYESAVLARGEGSAVTDESALRPGPSLLDLSWARKPIGAHETTGRWPGRLPTMGRPPSRRSTCYRSTAVCHRELGPQTSRQGPSQVCYSHVCALPWTGGLVGRRKFGLTLAAAIQAEEKDAGLQVRELGVGSQM